MIRRLEYFTIRALLAALRGLPYPTALRLARAAARTAYRFDASSRDRALRNLRLAYGDALGKREAEQIARGVFETISRQIAEAAHVTRQATRGLRIENPEILKDACARGRGVVVVSAHMGCFIRMVVIPRLMGVRAAVIMKKQRNDLILQWGIRHLKRHFDLDIIQKRDAREQVVEWLQAGRLVAFFADQHPRKGGFPARFFGREITAAGGPAVYAKRFGCPLVVFTAILHPDGTNVLRLDGPVSTEGSHEDISQRWVDLLEARIRDYPEQWTWMHRRWRGSDAESRDSDGAAGSTLDSRPSH